MEIRKFLSNARAKFIEFRIYYSRSIGYVSLINSGMILFLTLAKLKEVGIIKWDITDSFLLVYVVGFIGLLLFGWLEIKVFKGFQKESDRNFALTPSFVEMKEKLNYLYDKEKKKEEQSDN